MEDDYTQIMLEKKLKSFDIFKQALTVSFQNLKFIIFCFFHSLPFFCFLVFFEIIFQRICLETSKFFEPRDPYYLAYYEFYGFSQSFQLSLINLIPYQLLEFLNILIIVPRASRMYEAEESVSFRDIMICKTRLKGPLITSIYVHLLSTIILFALALSVFDCSIEGKSLTLITMANRVLFAALLVMFLVWGARWNMGLVISMLDEKDGIEALEFSAEIIFGKNCSLQWLMLMIGSFAWGFIIRMSCFFIYGYDVLEVTRVLFTCCLSCIGNVLKWVISVVYFLDHNKGSLENKDVNVYLLTP